ncbi:hypothetical protein AAG747_26415 [Rapidithrix thailandica]|uniref:DUF342 domain-containing protein n=1 Tax=Rapidithrix thailandica TaxID=413964 RepID=A0AAW9SGN1_9BACT
MKIRIVTLKQAIELVKAHEPLFIWEIIEQLESCVYNRKIRNETNPNDGLSDELKNQQLNLINTLDTDKIIEKLGAFSDEVLVYEGETKLKELILDKTIVIINGDLVVEQSIKDNYDDDCLFIVLGNVKVESIVTYSWMFISGNLTCENVTICDSSSNKTMFVCGNMRSKTILENGHSIIVGGKLNVEDIYYISKYSVQDENGFIEANSKTPIQEILNEDQSYMNLDKALDYLDKGGTKFTV